MKNLIKKSVFVVFSFAALGLSTPVLAYFPTLSAQYQGGGNNNIQISVSNAMPFSTISLYSRQSSSLWTVVNNIGQTDSSGYFSQVVSIPNDGSNSQIQMYVTVGGQQSSTISVNSNYGGCIYNCGGGNLSLSQTSLNLSIGQNSTITAYNNSGGAIYISSNSNSSVATVSVSGNQIYIYANQSGSTTISVCGNNNYCSTVYVSVSGGYSGGNLSLSQTSLNLNAGQTSTVTAYNNSGSIYISSNSNPSVASASVSGSQINVYANQSGSTTFGVCSNNNCVNLYVSVSGQSYNDSIWFNPPNPNLSQGQNMNVIIGSGQFSGAAYYISANSNSNVVSASINGSNLTLYGNQSGSSNITVCRSGYSNCGMLYVSVSGGYSGGNLSLSQTNLNLSRGQSSTVTAYNNLGGSIYISSNSNPSVASASVSGSQINIYGNQSGSTTISVCGNNNNCSSLYVSVSGSSGSNSNLWFSPQNPSVNAGQNTTVSINSNYYSGNSYYITSNSNPSVASASISGSTLNLYGNQSGSSTVTVCQSGNNMCGTLYVNVTGGYYNNPGYNNPGNILGLSSYQNGSLIKESGTVYIVYRNTKSGFASAAAFTGLGFNFNNVVNVSGSGLPDSGFIVRSASAQHPWGSWVKNGQTVYFVHEFGLIPVPNWDTFVNNSGQSSMVVSANSYDFRLPILSVMTYGDSRLR